MIELGKKYKLKKIKGPYGERFVFMKEFLIDPQKPDDIYSDLILERKE